MAFKDLLAFKKSFRLAMKVFEISKKFPKEETYSLTDQIRRSSRSVTVNISEAYRKRLYSKHFISKLIDSDAENSETQTWLMFAAECKEVGKLINYMINNPEKFGAK